MSDKKVLIIDDEVAILKMLSEMFSILNIENFTASNGEEGINIFKQHKDEINLVLLDILMPRVNGMVVFEEIKKINPDVPIIIISGYTNEPEILDFIVKHKLKFFRKPFHIEELMEAVKKILSK